MMQRVFLFRSLKNMLQMLLCAVLCVWFSFLGLPTHASFAKQPVSPSSCPVLPAHFDFTHASRQELRYYHIPSPPATSDPQAMGRWLKDVQGLKRIVCLPETYTHPVTYQGKHIVSGPAESCPQAAPQGTKCSLNWSGYTVSNNRQGFNDAYGTWSVPCVTGSGAGTAVSNWVGLGGVQENLWQGGSAWDHDNGYFLWYEAVGMNGTGGEQEIVSTHCGETIHAEVSFAPNDPSSNVTVDLLDVQSGTTYTKSAPSGFQSGQRTADWVDERPKCGKGFFGLANYHVSYWSDTYASANDPSAGFSSIGSLSYTRIWMVNDHDSDTRIAWVDSLGSNKGSGTDNYQGHWEAHGHSHCK